MSGSLVRVPKDGAPHLVTHGDEIWEHKKGRIWLLVKKLTQENRYLRYQVKVLQARVRRAEG